jgi:hypothetical protein
MRAIIFAPPLGVGNSQSFKNQQDLEAFLNRCNIKDFDIIKARSCTKYLYFYKNELIRINLGHAFKYLSKSMFEELLISNGIITREEIQPEPVKQKRESRVKHGLMVPILCSKLSE